MNGQKNVHSYGFYKQINDNYISVGHCHDGYLDRFGIGP